MSLLFLPSWLWALLCTPIRQSLGVTGSLGIIQCHCTRVVRETGHNFPVKSPSSDEPMSRDCDLHDCFFRTVPPFTTLYFALFLYLTSVFPVYNLEALICVDYIFHLTPLDETGRLEKGWSGEKFPSPSPTWCKILEFCSVKVLTLGEKAFVMVQVLDVFHCLTPWPPSIPTGDLSSVLPVKSALVPGENAYKNVGPLGLPPRSFWFFISPYLTSRNLSNCHLNVPTNL